VSGELLPAPAKVVGSHFDIGSIVVAVRSVIDASVSLRASSRICDLLAVIQGQPSFEEPCHTTVQNFILRIGLYLIEHHAGFNPNRIWIIDHTIAAGTTKCLVVLGLDLSVYLQCNRPLEHHDLETLALIPVNESNGAIVCQQLVELGVRKGLPLSILSDRGSDLKKGVELMQKENPDVISLDDIVHLVSRLIQKLLEQDDRWDQYRQANCKCANAVRQGPLAHLKPPRPKTKARYMNIDREVRWGARALSLLDRVRSGQLNERQKKRLPRELIETNLDWLDAYREGIEIWLELSSLGQRASHVIRYRGYAPGTIDLLCRELGEPKHAAPQQLVAQIIEHVTPMCHAASAHVRLPGSSEVLESLIGKGKQLLGQSHQNSLTRQVLAMATATAELTESLIRTALTVCRIKHLKTWCKTYLDPGVHVARREDLQPSKEELNWRKAHTVPIPNF
jgi:hypothetical protein